MDPAPASPKLPITENPAAPPPEPARGFAALKNPVVRAFALGRLVAVLGVQIISVAVGWELYQRTNDPWALGLVGLVELLPVLVLMVPAGTLADRVPRRHMAMLSAASVGLAALGLAWVSMTDGPVNLIYACLLFIGVARAIGAPSIGTMMPQLLKPHEFANANAWLSSTWQLASISGPAAGGLLIGLSPDGDATVAYLVAFAGQLAFIALLSRVPIVRPQAQQAEGASERAAGLLVGFDFVRRNPVFLAAITLDLFAVLFGGAVALLPIYARDILKTGPEGLGWLRSAPALGALLMALTQAHLPPWKRPGVALLVTVVGFGLATIGFGLSTNLWLSLVCLFLTGVFDEVSVVIRSTLEQVITPDALRGRVAAVNHVFIGFSNELGAFESGAAASLLGPVLAVVSGGVASLAVVGIVLALWPQLRRLGPLHEISPTRT
jgi:MFS family permease